MEGRPPASSKNPMGIHCAKLMGLHERPGTDRQLLGLRRIAKTDVMTKSRAASPARPGRSETPASAPWGKLIPEEQWTIFRSGTEALEQAGVPYLLHGALGLATYTGHWRNTKDVDVVVRAADRERAVAAVSGAGFGDYFEQESYDRSWIFRGTRDGVLFDVIWDLPNHRVAIDDAWFDRAEPLVLRGQPFSVVPPEELIRVKLYVMQRERCDWVDVLNVLAGAAARLDWQTLVDRMGPDVGLLQGVLAVFNWLCPERARLVPGWLREQFALQPADEAAEPEAREERRVRLFDSRPWFAMRLPADRVLER